MSSYRYFWQKDGFTIPASAAKDIKSHISPWSHFLGWKFTGMTLPLKSDGVDWRKGIKLVPSGLGLPDHVDQCSVVPIVANVSGVDPDKTSEIGSLDDMASLPEIEKYVFGAIFAGVPEELAKLVLAVDASRFTTKQKSELLAKQGWNSFSYFGFAADLNSQLEMRDCTWWNDNTPKDCLIEDTGIDWRFMFESKTKIQFWMNGYLKSGFIKTTIPVPENQSLPQSVKIECPRGAISYRFDGSLESCNLNEGKTIKENF